MISTALSAVTDNTVPVGVEIKYFGGADKLIKS